MLSILCVCIKLCAVDQVFFEFVSIFMRLRQFFKPQECMIFRICQEFTDTQIYNLLVYIMLIEGLINLIFQGLITLLLNILLLLERLHFLSSTSNTLIFTFKVLKVICDFYLSGNSLFLGNFVFFF